MLWELAPHPGQSREGQPLNARTELTGARRETAASEPHKAEDEMVKPGVSSLHINC